MHCCHCILGAQVVARLEPALAIYENVVSATHRAKDKEWKSHANRVWRQGTISFVLSWCEQMQPVNSIYSACISQVVAEHMEALGYRFVLGWECIYVWFGAYGWLSLEMFHMGCCLECNRMLSRGLEDPGFEILHPPTAEAPRVGSRLLERRRPICGFSFRALFFIARLDENELSISASRQLPSCSRRTSPKWTAPRPCWWCNTSGFRSNQPLRGLSRFFRKKGSGARSFALPDGKSSNL